jgi:peptide/nickel transport system substrate-binding protein
MTRFFLLRGLAGLLAFGLGACRPAHNETTSEFPRSQTLYIAGRQWGEPASFNPLLSQPDFPAGSSLMYENLFYFDAQAGSLRPMIAESYTVANEEIMVTLRPEAHWSDGKPITAHDVKYSFEIGKKYKSLPMSPIWQYLTSVTVPETLGESKPSAADHPRTIVFELNKDRHNPLTILDALGSIRIIPRHSIEPILDSLNGDIEAFNKLKFDKDAVSSGPYKLYSYSSEKIVTVRDDEYWGNKAMHDGQLPAPKYIIHPMYKSSDHYSVALQQGQIDIGSTFIPRIWLKAKHGVHAWLDKPPFFPPACMPMLFVNHKRKPLDDVHFRRAMAFAINYDDVRDLAIAGYADPLKPGLILPFGTEAKYYSEEDAKKYGTKYDPVRARAELAAGGYKAVWSGNGELESTLDAASKPIATIRVLSPTGWTDWEQIIHIVVKSLRASGIDAREKYVDTSIFWNMWFTADFDLLMMTPSGSPTPSKPWSRFESLLSTRDFAPVGAGKMYSNQGRYNDPKAPGYIARIDELLTVIPKLTTDEELTAAYRELNRIFMEQQPTLPLFYRPEWFYEYNEKFWTGYPNARHPYLPPSVPGDGLGTQMLWSLKPTSAN